MNKTFEKNSGGRLTYNGPVKARAGSHITKDVRYKTQENIGDFKIAK